MIDAYTWIGLSDEDRSNYLSLQKSKEEFDKCKIAGINLLSSVILKLERREVNYYELTLLKENVVPAKNRLYEVFKSWFFEKYPMDFSRRLSGKNLFYYELYAFICFHIIGISYVQLGNERNAIHSTPWLASNRVKDRIGLGNAYVRYSRETAKLLTVLLEEYKKTEYE